MDCHNYAIVTLCVVHKIVSIVHNVVSAATATDNIQYCEYKYVSCINDSHSHASP